MITDSQAEAACAYIRDKSPEYAKAEAERIQLSEFRKSKKALLMNEKQGEPEHVRASYAYAHDDYIALLDAIKDAVEREETIRWRIEAARLQVEIWRTQSSNNRAQDQSHR